MGQLSARLITRYIALLLNSKQSYFTLHAHISVTIVDRFIFLVGDMEVHLVATSWQEFGYLANVHGHPDNYD
jgi:hypothetical protein